MSAATGTTVDRLSVDLGSSRGRVLKNLLHDRLGLVGGILLLATGAAHGALSLALLTVAVAFGTINVVGGFLVTDRMLEMFKPKPQRDEP